MNCFFFLFFNDEKKDASWDEKKRKQNCAIDKLAYDIEAEGIGMRAFLLVSLVIDEKAEDHPDDLKKAIEGKYDEEYNKHAVAICSFISSKWG